MKTSIKKLILTLVLIILSLSLFACDFFSNNRTRINTTGTLPSLTLYEDVNSFFSKQTTNRYTCVLVEYTHRDLENYNNNLEYNVYYGIDNNELYMSQILNNTTNEAKSPNDEWVVVEDEILYLYEGLTNNTKTVLANPNTDNVLNTFMEYTKLDYTVIENINNSDIDVLASGVRRVNYSYSDMTNNLSSLMNWFPIFDDYSEILTANYQIDFEVTDESLKIDILADSNPAEFFSDLLTRVQIEIRYPLSIRKLSTNDIKLIETKVPNVNINDEELTYASYAFSLDIIDADEVLNIDSIKIYIEDMFQAYTTVNNLSFSNLFPETTYVLKIFASYDLNDGFGVRTTTYEKSFTTLERPDPNISFTKTITSSSVMIRISSTLDNVDVRLEYYTVYTEGNLVVQSNCSGDSVTIYNLESNTNYVISVCYVFNLNDGLGEVFTTKDIEIKTKL